MNEDYFDASKLLSSLNLEIKEEEIGKMLVRKAQEICPVETGKMRDSINSTVNNNQITVDCPVDYALDQHENYYYHHKQGQSHFLINPLLNSESEIEEILKT